MLDAGHFRGERLCRLWRPGNPLSINQTGIRAFCAEEDAVVRVDPAGVCSTDETGLLKFNPLNQ